MERAAISLVQGGSVFDQIQRRMRGLVRSSRYSMTTHGNEEMEQDGFTVFDIEQIILTGRIIERQKDYETGQWKYVVAGESLLGRHAEVVVKLGRGPILVIITVYRV